MPFVTRGPAAPAPANPADLYRELPKDAGAPANVWLHQGDLLRVYHRQHLNTPDVALELPTGAGKTLVGMLIADWRRRANEERAAYLCLTRQLARQVTARATSYGIRPVTLIGRHTQWNPADRMRFEAGQAVAITTYSTVFNSNPHLDSAQLLVLDDAHAAENYVANPWGLKIDRDDPAYQDVLALLDNALDPVVISRLRCDSADLEYANTIYLVSIVGMHAVADELEQTLRTAAAADGISESARHALRLLSGHLAQCLAYVSYRSLLLRPLIPPTAFHPAFAGANQRVYLSATLGDGGEIERTFGRHRIVRVPVPEGWDKQGIGRRFFCLPEAT